MKTILHHIGENIVWVLALTLIGAVLFKEKATIADMADLFVFFILMDIIIEAADWGIRKYLKRRKQLQV